VAEFNPDAFLAENPSKPGFNPDQFLADTEGAAPPEPKPIPKLNAEPLKTLKPPKEGEAPKEATTFLEAIEAGYDISVAGLAINKEKPDMVLPENAPMFHRIASQVTTIAADLPVMVAGAFGGGAVGSAAGTAIAGPVGTAPGALVGGAFGADALPTAIRETLMAAYDEGSVDSFEDFWEKASPVMIETLKSGFTGAATLGVGSKVGKVVAPLAKSGVAALVATKTAVAASEIATMTTVGAALHGRVPEPEEFVDAAILVGGIHTAVSIGGKIRKTYSKTGIKPDQMVNEMESSPTIKEDLNSSNIEIPRVLDDSKSDVVLDGELGEKSNVFNDESPVTVAKTDNGPEITPQKDMGEKSEILSRIAENPKKPSLTMDDVVTNVLDDLNPLKQIDNEAYISARNYRGVQGLVVHFVEEGVTDFKTGKTVGKPLKKILEPHNKDIDGFTEFAIAKRAKELHGREIETGIKPETADSVVKNGTKYEKAFKELNDYQNGVLKYLKDSGVLSEEAFSKIQEANKSYVPMYRVFDDAVGGPKGAGKGLTLRNPIKKIKGGDQKLANPIESIAKNTAMFLQLAERARVIKELTSEANVESGLVQKTKNKMKPIEVTAKEVTKFLEEHGIDDVEGEAFNIFRPVKKQHLAADEIVAYEDGKRVIYKVPEAVSTAINALDRESAGLLLKILAAPASALRAGATLTPDFIVRNALRDQSSAFVFSKNGYVPVVDLMRGFGSLMKKDTSYWEWMKAGGMNAHMTAIDDTYIKSNVWGLDKETGFISKVRNPVKSVVQLLRVSSELIENGTRLGEFKKARSSGKSEKQSAYESREVTLDFARMGAKTKSVNMITAFWNAHVQGLDRARRAFQDDPVGTTAKVGASITLPSVALWWANHDDPRWKEIPRWQKDLFWIVMTDDNIYRIPKPFELGMVFGSLPERALEAFFTENPKAMQGFGEAMMNAFTPGIIPTFATPVVSHYANKNTFTGFPIIPRAKENVLPELQYSDYTSETAKMLGKLVGYMPVIGDTSASSPAVIENYISAWSGNLGRYSLNLADEALLRAGVTKIKEKPTTPLAAKPVIRAFMIRYPGASAQSIQDFYDNHNHAEKIYNSMKLIKKTDGDKAAQEFAKENPSELRAFSQLKKTKKAMGAMHKMIDAIEINPKIKPDEKRQMIDSVYYKMINSAKYGNEILEKIKSRNEKGTSFTEEDGDEE
jgi:hypothetical protein